MSYKALYRKYRPVDFNDVLGQDQIVATLEKIISSDKISHAYLFSGPRGTGKTSVAHVFAREINKTASGNINTNQLDIIEIDAASNNGVAEVRTLIESSKYAPTESKFKVYIIDEVHMLTKGAFNALLKTLEEPPAHVIFILATTEPEKVPITILSRLQRFNFMKIDQKVIATQLKAVFQKESITADDESIRFIARLAQGGMRDALSIADQAAAYSNNAITFDAISKVFGIVSTINQIKLIKLAYEKDAKNVLMLATQFIEGGVDLERLVSSLIDVLRDFIVYQKTNDQSFLETLTVEEIASLSIGTNFAYHAIETLIELIGKIKQSLMARQTFELALLKITNRNDNENINKPQPEIKEPSSDKIFETAETKVHETDNNPQEEPDVLPDEPKNSEQDSQIIDTDELELTAVSVLETQEIDVNDSIIAEDVLSTQEIELEGVGDKTTDEIDLVSMFNSNTEDIKVESIKIGQSVDNIINILIQADKTKVNDAKEKLSAIAKHASDQKFKSYISLFDNIKLIAKGNGFALITSSSDDVANQIRRDTSRQSQIDFVNQVFDEPTKLFVVTLDEFEEVKKHYQELVSTNNLPTAIPIVPPKVLEKPKSEHESYGNDLFGDLFS